MVTYVALNFSVGLLHNMSQSDKKTQKIPFKMLISAYYSTDVCYCNK